MDMKKLLGALTLVLLQVTGVSAQIQKGDWLVGGNFFASTSKLNEGKTRSFSTALGSNIGYFVRDGLRLGLSVQTNLSRTREDGKLKAKHKQIDIGPTISYYLLLSNKIYWVNKFGYSTELYKSTNYWRFSDEEEASTYKGTRARIHGSTGLGYFLSSNWSIEGTLTASLTSSSNSYFEEDYNNVNNNESLSLYTNIGFRYFITNKGSRQRTNK